VYITRPLKVYHPLYLAFVSVYVLLDHLNIVYSINTSFTSLSLASILSLSIGCLIFGLPEHSATKQIKSLELTQPNEHSKSRRIKIEKIIQLCVKNFIGEEQKAEDKKSPLFPINVQQWTLPSV
jgi:hypothetical protein